MRWQDFTVGPGYAASGTANGLVFHASIDNTLRAYDVDALLAPPLPGLPNANPALLVRPIAGPGSSAPAIVGDTVYIGSGTSTSDACQKPSDDPLSEVAFEACRAAFDDALGTTGAIHAFRLPAAVQPSAGRLYSPQGNKLDVYDLALPLPVRQNAIENESNDPVRGYDINAQVYSFPDGKHILVGEDTYQSDGFIQGWGVFDTTNGHQVGKLIADYGSVGLPDQYGCVIETDGAGSASRKNASSGLRPPAHPQRSIGHRRRVVAELEALDAADRAVELWLGADARLEHLREVASQLDQRRLQRRALAPRDADLEVERGLWVDAVAQHVAAQPRDLERRGELGEAVQRA